ncbi:hypothetical protein BGY98DRAFT_1098401 [Russula aff. rugulosa BPL654]|nr:hypothetical protein BGY98DRAFT_1098401 [Russula aff. rugulosa BPL654]
MSRLIVKNLPSYITPTLLKEHFSQPKGPHGTITDVKVILKQDGAARRFGFVGFKTDEEALKAKEWYDKTFIDSTRVRVDIIDSTKDAPPPRPNKRRRLDASSPSPDKESAPVSQGVLKETSEGAQQDLTDMEWMRQRMKEGVVDVDRPERVFEQSDSEEESQGVSEEKDPTEETILRTARLFVRNLTFACTEEELRPLFQPFGAVSQVHIPIDTVTKGSKGLAFVTYARPEDAIAAFRGLDKKPFQGRLLHIIGAVDRNNSAATSDNGSNHKSLKGQRSEKRRATAGKEFNWGMLYMNSDAVLSSVADRMNISKSDILDPESPDAAVKLALAETHIIQETKTYLESHGVILSAFSGRERSETIILVKNIPYGTTGEQLREMFGVHGELQHVLVPPAGTLAVIEFVHADEARKAFRAIAYRRLGNSVMYLEKGPLGMFQPTSATSEVANGVAPIAIEESEAGDDVNVDITKGKTLFVKNLAFATSSERFTQAFRHLPDFAFARLQTKPDPKRPGSRLSMGFGFVGFRSAEAARKALKGMHGYVLDGHSLSVKFAGRGAEEQEEKKGGREKAKTTKMLVKNVPFEATRKDIQALFSAHGQLKSVRLPKRFDRRSRGFAFLEFWAEEGDANIDELRRKAGVGFGDGSDMPGRKRKLVLDEDDEGGDDDT